MLDKYKIKALIRACQEGNKTRILSLAPVPVDRRVQLLFNRDPEGYMNGLRGVGGDILRYIVGHRNLAFNRVRNEVVAERVGCSVRTVQRWTARFVRGGILEKSRRTQWSSNDYVVRLTKRGSFLLWLGGLSDEERAKWEQGIGSSKGTTDRSFGQSVTPSYKYSNINNLFIKIYPSNARAREEGSWITQKRKRIETEPELIARRECLKELVVLNKEQSTWIREHRHDQNIKELLRSDRFRPHFYTPLVCKVQDLLHFSDQDCLKLAVYPDEAVEYGYNIAHNFKKKNKPVRVRSVVGWFISMLSEYCTQNNLFYDKALYFDLCRILNLETDISKEINKPFIIVKIGERRAEDPYATHANIKRMDKEIDRVFAETPESKIRSIRKLEENMGNNPKYAAFAEFAAIGIKNSLCCNNEPEG